MANANHNLVENVFADKDQTKVSKTSIDTDSLRPCMIFLGHYIFSIEETNLCPLECLIKIFQFISGELNRCLNINLFVYEHTIQLSNLYY